MRWNALGPLGFAMADDLRVRERLPVKPRDVVYEIQCPRAGVELAVSVPVALVCSVDVLPVCHYYEGFGKPIADMLATGAIGWHYDAGITALRMIVSGVFDRFPDLQMILGHWGEVVLFYLDRISVLDGLAHLQRPIADYFRSNIHVTPGGIASHKYLRWTLETLGADRIMYASDYPFNRERDGAVTQFLNNAPASQDQRALIAHTNWDKLVANIRR